MHISDFLLDVATSYDRHADMSASAQILLRGAGEAFDEHLPAGFEVIGSGGKGRPTYTPWVGFFDPDETTTPENGLYVVYLFAEDLETVTLSLMQGITQLTRELGRANARARLTEDSYRIRQALGANALVGLSADMDLRSSGFRQQAYEAGNIAAVAYAIGTLPEEGALRLDLVRFIALYQEAVLAKRQLLLESPGAISTASTQQFVEVHDPFQDFRPKDDSDYVAHIEGHQQRKSRRHETMVRQYGEWVGNRGFACSTKEHPVDLVLRREGRIWLVEAKVVGSRPAAAVREAVGQLLEYRHFLYQDGMRPVMVALFSEPIGDAFVEYLSDLDIVAAWKAGESWEGPERSAIDGLSL